MKSNSLAYSDFSGHPCPEIADRERDNKKISFSCAMTADAILYSCLQRHKLIDREKRGTHMNYREAMEYMEELGQYGTVMGLTTMRELCARLGNPQDQLKFVHIAGTNGKGSVLAYVSTVLHTAGYRVGRYISPAVKDYRERFQIGGRMITQASLCNNLQQVKEAAEAMAAEGLPHPTAFEVETAVAFL